MQFHRAAINSRCRFCKCVLSDHFKVSSYQHEINTIYNDDGVDVANDDPDCQSMYMCRNCYKTAIKAREEISHRKKNPNSKKTFIYSMPLYNENVRVFRGEIGDEDGAVMQAGPAEQPPDAKTKKKSRAVMPSILWDSSK